AEVMTVCLFIFMLMQPVVGAISDKIGRKNSMLIFVTGMIILPVPLLTAIGAQTSIVTAGFLILVAMVFLSFYSSISGIVKAEMFPAYIRGLGVSFTYALANSLFGGSAEYIALSMKNYGYGEVFPWYFVTVAVLGLVAVLFMRDNRLHSTIDNPDANGFEKGGVLNRPATMPPA
ncbi:MAG: MFS transporter, partial [Edaphobacter sp.]